MMNERPRSVMAVAFLVVSLALAGMTGALVVTLTQEQPSYPEWPSGPVPICVERDGGWIMPHDPPRSDIPSCSR